MGSEVEICGWGPRRPAVQAQDAIQYRQMWTFRRDHKSVGDNETFVQLIRVAMEDDDLRSQLVCILSLDTFNRQSALNSFLEEMRLKQAPQEFIVAIGSFLDDCVAERALAILKG